MNTGLLAGRIRLTVLDLQRQRPNGMASRDDQMLISSQVRELPLDKGMPTRGEAKRHARASEMDLGQLHQQWGDRLETLKT